MPDPPHVQTKREIRSLLAAAGVEPRRRFGQHFLIDGNLMRRLASCAELGPTDWILEVGGGTGGLTDLLIEAAQAVACIEVDRRLHALLALRYSGHSNLTLIRGDILEGKHHLHKEVTAWLEAAPGQNAATGQNVDAGQQAPARQQAAAGQQTPPDDLPSSVKLVANLPYQIATPLVMNLLVDHPRVRRLCFMVQAEVADRFTAAAGGSAYGPVSIVAQSLGRVETVARVPSQAFWPRPAVDSKIIRMDVTESPFADRTAVRRFATLLRGLFEHRRKTLRSSLKYVVDRDVGDLVAAHFDVSRRPESLDVEDWLAMSRLVFRSNHGIPNLKKQD